MCKAWDDHKRAGTREGKEIGRKEGERIGRQEGQKEGRKIGEAAGNQSKLVEIVTRLGNTE